jgi:hypothetical protein
MQFNYCDKLDVLYLCLPWTWIQGIRYYWAGIFCNAFWLWFSSYSPKFRITFWTSSWGRKMSLSEFSITSANYGGISVVVTSEIMHWLFCRNVCVSLFMALNDGFDIPSQLIGQTPFPFTGKWTRWNNEPSANVHNHFTGFTAIFKLTFGILEILTIFCDIGEVRLICWGIRFCSQRN